MTNLLLGVIGNPIGHSLSPAVHKFIGQQVGIDVNSVALQCDEEELKKCLQEFFDGGGNGLSVTLPFKNTIFDLLKQDNCSDVATEAKAVNCLLKTKTNTVTGHNTDGLGLVADLARVYPAGLQDKTVLIAGAGGAASGVVSSIIDAQPKEIVIANRTMNKAMTLCELHGQKATNMIATRDPLLPNSHYDIMINTTSAGIDKQPPADYLGAAIEASDFVYDLMYNSSGSTAICDMASVAGVASSDGLGMLVAQAAHAFEIWSEGAVKAQQVDVLAIVDQLRQ